MASQRFSLDTNILVYAVDRDAGERHEAARSIMLRAAQADCLLTLQALGEFFHAVTRKQHLTPQAAQSFVDNWREVFPVTAAGEQALVDAMQSVHEDKLSFWDAMILATASEASCAVLLTEDMQAGRVIDGVEIVNPFAPEAAARLERLMPEG
jgi:predicted nucleic acid-binding protein